VNGRSGERWLQQVLDAMPEQIAVLGRYGTILMVNEAWQRFGRENGNPEPMGFGVNYLEVCRRASMHRGENAEQARRVLAGLRTVLDGTCESFQEEYACHSPGERRWFVVTATPLTASPGGALVTHVDVTARKIREQEILRQAHEDPLTGLANRRHVEARALQVLAGARRTGSSAAVVAIDLDGFKAINDTFGHHAGDLVLRGIAERLAARTSPPGLLARTGGDELVALLPGADARAAQAAVETYRAAFARPLSVEGREIQAGASLGFALFPEQGATFHELLRAADEAMYRAKAASAARPPREGARPEPEERRPTRERSWRQRRSGRWGRRVASRR
jgi:diguanylate cyclase (GGDEF)-like protein/PAS domain S-box-containing protein